MPLASTVIRAPPGLILTHLAYCAVDGRRGLAPKFRRRLRSDRFPLVFGVIQLRGQCALCLQTISQKPKGMEMTKRIIASLVAAGIMITGAQAGDGLKAHCETVTAENDGAANSEGCACLAETADEAATKELLAYSAGDDTALLSEAAQAAIAACFAPPEAAEG